MTITTLPEAFDGTPIDIIEIGNERWVRGGQIVPPLGFADYDSIKKIMRRNPGDFGPDETMTVELPSRGGMQLTRLFSERGIAKLAMLATSPQATKFRDWAATVLTTPRQPAPPLLQPSQKDHRDEIIDLQRELINQLKERAEERLLRARPLKDGEAKPRWWRQDEDDYLVSTFGATTTREIAMTLGRSRSSVLNRVGHLRMQGLIPETTRGVRYVIR